MYVYLSPFWRLDVLQNFQEHKKINEYHAISWLNLITQTCDWKVKLQDTFILLGNNFNSIYF